MTVLKSIALASGLLLASLATSGHATIMQAVFTGDAVNVRDGVGISGSPIVGSGNAIDPSPVSITVLYDSAVGEAFSNGSTLTSLAGGAGIAIDPVAHPIGPISSVSMSAYGRNFTVTQGVGSKISFSPNALIMSLRAISPVVGGNNVDFFTLNFFNVPSGIIPDEFDTPFAHTKTTVTSTSFAFSIHGFDEIFTSNVRTFSGDLELRSLTVSEVVAPVPLPAGLPLMLVGLGAFAWMRRRAS